MPKRSAISIVNIVAQPAEEDRKKKKKKKRKKKNEPEYIEGLRVTGGC